MAYNFGSNAYHSCLSATPTLDMDPLKKAVIKKLHAFDSKVWFNEPIVTMIGTEVLANKGDTEADTVDAFGKVNGRQRLAPREVVDKVMAHMKQFKAPTRDLRAALRKIENQFFDINGDLAAFLVSNQAMDFHKQDGITEIEESNEAFAVERKLNDALLADEDKGLVVIGRSPALVGAVSNFSNFLDLCRKMIRNIELGVPVVVLSRTNTTQHMFRYTQVFVKMLAAEGVDPRMVTYLCADVESLRRMMSANPSSPMYFTGSRPIAEKIKQVAPKLCASTGGPNTMVAEDMTPGVAAAAQMSHCIEHKGQCTAMRHLVIPRKLTVGDLASSVYAPTKAGLTPLVTSSANALETNQFSALFEGKPLSGSILPGYSAAPGSFGTHAAVKVGQSLPVNIDERWREAYLDVTTPSSLDEKFLDNLAQWCNVEQPISLAVNCTDLNIARRLFENTSLVVYTVGNPNGHGGISPALTCQARPQDGEIFGEVPPRKILSKTSRFPVFVPTSTPGYNTTYSSKYLADQGQQAAGSWGLPGGLKDIVAVISKVRNAELRGYCRLILSYLADAAGSGPRRSVGKRTALFGWQRPPLGRDGSTCIRFDKPSAGCSEADLLESAMPFLLPFVSTNAASQLVASIDPSLGAMIKNGLASLGVRNVKVESRTSYEAAVSVTGSFWNVIDLAKDATKDGERCLVSHFVSVILPFGHAKSSSTNDEAFLKCFSASDKWLQCPAQSAGVSASKL